MTAPPRVLLLRGPGTNCDGETAFAFAQSGAEVEPTHLAALAREPKRLRDFHILAIPGGFTYGDDLGSGKVMAVEIRRYLLDELRGFVAGGGLVLGICNGFQALVKAGLLPGLAWGEIEATLTANASARFEDRWVHLRGESDRSPLVRTGDRFYVPVNHGEGRFVPRDERVLEAMRRNGQIVLRYAGPDGAAHPPYPWNPNDSTDAIAGVSDPTGRIVGLMPHPEKHLFPYMHPQWTRLGEGVSGSGAPLFERAVMAAKRLT